MQNLKYSIKQLKRVRNDEANQKKARMEMEQDQLARASIALQEKAVKYQNLQQGKTLLLPKSSLVDFETKLNQVLEHEESDRDDQISRSKAAFAPPASLSSNPNVLRKTVDDILSNVFLQNKQD
jgi:hypothetical protein